MRFFPEIVYAKSECYKAADPNCTCMFKIGGCCSTLAYSFRFRRKCKKILKVKYDALF